MGDVKLGLTPFQTAGPFLSIGLCAGRRADEPKGDDRVVVAGRLIDGAGSGIDDGVLEFWQPELGVFSRILTGTEGHYEVELVPSPFISLLVLGRGILTRHYTRIYLENTSDLGGDAVLQRVPEPRRHTLIARKVDDRRYHFDVILQGARETVFFDV